MQDMLLVSDAGDQIRIINGHMRLRAQLQVVGYACVQLGDGREALAEVRKSDNALLIKDAENHAVIGSINNWKWGSGA